jgi:hypothetical protein
VPPKILKIINEEITKSRISPFCMGLGMITNEQLR